MSKYIHNAGAFYSYIARGLGKPAGLGAAALAVSSYNANPDRQAARHRRYLRQEPALAHPGPAIDQDDSPYARRSWSRCPPRTVGSMSRPRTGCVGSAAFARIACGATTAAPVQAIRSAGRASDREVGLTAA